MRKTVDRGSFIGLLLALAVVAFPLRGMGDDSAPVLDRAAWERLADKHNYSDEIAEVEEAEAEASTPEPEYTPQEESWLDRNFQDLSTIVLSIVVILLLTLIVYLVIRQLNEREIAVVRSDLSDYTLEQLDATVGETELERFLRESLERKEFRAAVRIYYLLVLNRLNERRLIKWERDKTNRAYLNELSDTALCHRFAELTLTYEMMWYGEAPLDETVFDRIRPDFARFIQHLNNG